MMDTSKKYIEMCEKAEEIQAERILGRCEFGDLFYLEDGFAHGGKFRFIGSYDGYETDHGYDIIDKTLIRRSFWLPRQDQLQEMAAKMPTWTDTRPINVLCRFWNWWNSSDWNLCSDNTTLEQLWLAFVMKEKYNKTWSGKEWIK
ncbi:hypothetical protein ES702_03084 [subsurface metagenome]